jgi:hypothetical protein
MTFCAVDFLSQLPGVEIHGGRKYSLDDLGRDEQILRSCSPSSSFQSRYRVHDFVHDCEDPRMESRTQPFPPLLCQS